MLCSSPFSSTWSKSLTFAVGGDVFADDYCFLAPVVEVLALKFDFSSTEADCWTAASKLSSLSFSGLDLSSELPITRDDRRDDLRGPAPLAPSAAIDAWDPFLVNCYSCFWSGDWPDCLREPLDVMDCYFLIAALDLAVDLPLADFLEAYFAIYYCYFRHSTQ